MRFARHLQDTQTPEWKKAYIDYHRLKVQLGVIRAQALLQVDTSSSFGNTDIDHIDHPAPNLEVEDDESEDGLRGIATPARIANHLWVSGVNPTTTGSQDQSGYGAGSSTRWRTNNHERIPSFGLAMTSLPQMTGAESNAPLQPASPASNVHHSPVVSRSKDPGSRPSPPLHVILSDLPAARAKFFNILDAELGKIANFYVEREKEMCERAKLLRRQLNELEVHRQIYYESSAHLREQSWAKRAGLSILAALLSVIHNTKHEEPRRAGEDRVLASESGLGGRRVFAGASNLGIQASEHGRIGGDHVFKRKDGMVMGVAEASLPRGIDNSVRLPPKRSVAHPNVPLSGTQSSHDPHGYLYAKRRLRKAVAEHYRGLEILNNYRILNLTGFRKVLKKYEKITKTPVVDAYTKEKVEPSALVSSAVVGTLLQEMETLFAIKFERGNRKRAKVHLRVGPPSKTTDSITSYFALWLGLAIPAIAAGIYLSFQEYTRRTLPSWNILLLIYSTFTIPVLMVLLIGINVFAWARNKINYVFIFKLDPRSRHNHQEYFELPSFLLCMLAHGFWLSMAQLGPPMLWPLLWLCLTILVVFNPFHSIMYGTTRWWAIKKTAKLGTSGMWNVEFIDLWLGDQTCSLVYPLANSYLVGCFYTHSNLLSSAHDPRAQEILSACGITRNWGWYYLFGMLPFLVRFVQSLRRYRDSKLLGQLVNAGKYGMGMIQLFFYCYWRHKAMPHTGKSYVLFCLASTASSLYAYAWDVAVDWSMCQPYARYPLLRRELAYKSHIPFYYLALASNLCIRFIWLTYIFFDGTSIELHTFIAGMLEMLRRVQWNFYRVENKHLNNTEEHRVTREVPLPYHFDSHPSEEEVYIARLQLRKRLARLS